MRGSQEHLWKRLLLVLLFLGLPTLDLAACQFRFTLTGPSGKPLPLLPGTKTTVRKGVQYTLAVHLFEDHGGCPLKPQETVFLVSDQKWKTSKTKLPLVLQKDIQWIRDPRSTWLGTATFVPTLKETQFLQVVRDCAKGGYSEYFYFEVI